MRLGKWGIVALVLGVALNAWTNSALAQFADESGHYQTAYKSAQMAGDSLEAYNSYSEEGVYSENGGYIEGGDCAIGSCNSGDCATGDCTSGYECSDCECSDCQGGGIGLGNLMGGCRGFLGRPGQFFFGATYVYARADFSEALAYVERQGASANPFVPGQDTFHMYDFNYNSSYGLDGGYRLIDCGGEIRFSFLRLTSDADFAASPGPNSTILIPQGCCNIELLDEMERVQGYASTDLKSYDLGFSKTIPLGSPLDCCDRGCGDSVGCDVGCDVGCGDGCGCCWCPTWDLTWSVGVRIIDLDWSHGYSVVDEFGAPNGASHFQMNFQGAGPRVGVLGRRYLGRCGCFSLFAKGDIALLLGDVDFYAQGNDGTAGAGGTTRAEFTNIIPETDIEVGGTIHVGKCLNLSAGYFFAAFHDLGMRDSHAVSEAQLSNFDDANILGFDGFFARAEVAF